MNRSLAQWLAEHPGGAVVLTGLLGLLPLMGLGFAFFLPGAVPALIVLVRGPRAGLSTAIGASALLCGAIFAFGRPLPVGLIYSGWVLGPPLLLAMLYVRTGSLSMCLQVATLLGALALVALHGAFGDPQHFWEPFVRDFAQQMQQHGVPTDVFDEGLADTLARTLWGWIVVLTLVLAMCALYVARWWQGLAGHGGGFAEEFRSQRLGVVLGLAAGLVILASLFTEPPLLDDVGRLFTGALVIVGLGALHRTVASGRLATGWLYVAYALLVFVAPLAVLALAGLGFVDNWLRSTGGSTPRAVL